jgi:hypothetical protein
MKKSLNQSLCVKWITEQLCWRLPLHTLIQTNAGAYEAGDRKCLEAHIVITVPPQILIPSLTIHSLIFPINIHRGVSLRTPQLDLFTNEGVLQNNAKDLTVLDTVVLGVNGGGIKGCSPPLYLIKSLSTS